MTWNPMVTAVPVRNKAISFHAENQLGLFVRFHRHSVGKIQCNNFESKRIVHHICTELNSLRGLILGKVMKR